MNKKQIVEIEALIAEIAFLEGFVKRHKVTISDLLATFVEHLRKTEEELSLHPDIKKFAGMIPKDVDVRKEYYEHIEKKHK